HVAADDGAVKDVEGREQRGGAVTFVVVRHRPGTARPFDALRHEPRLPSPHHRLRFARAAHELGGAVAFGSGQNDVGPPYVLLRRATIRDDRLKSMAVRSGDVHDNSCSHAESLNCFARFGYPPKDSNHYPVCVRAIAIPAREYETPGALPGR